MLFIVIAAVVGLGLVAAAAIPAYLDSRNDPANKDLRLVRRVGRGRQLRRRATDDPATGGNDHKSRTARSIEYATGAAVLRPALGGPGLPGARVLHRAGPARRWSSSSTTSSTATRSSGTTTRSRAPSSTRSRTSRRAPAPTTPSGRPASSSCRAWDDAYGDFPAGKHVGMSHWGAEAGPPPAVRQGQRRGGRELHREVPGQRRTGAQRRLAADRPPGGLERGLVRREPQGVRRQLGVAPHPGAGGELAALAHDRRGRRRRRRRARQPGPRRRASPTHRVAHRRAGRHDRRRRAARCRRPPRRAPTRRTGADRRAAATPAPSGRRARRAAAATRPTGPGRAGDATTPSTRSHEPRTKAAGVPRSSQYAVSTWPRTSAPDAIRPGKVSRSTDTGRPGRDGVDDRPAEDVAAGVDPGWSPGPASSPGTRSPGRARRSARSRTARGSSTSVRCRVTSAPAATCRATCRARSCPDSTSPLRMTTGSSGPLSSSPATLRMPPPVPSGSSSVT